MKIYRYDPEFDTYSKWHNICPEGTWKIVTPTELSGLIPDSLLSKSYSALVMSSGSPPISVYVANINRIDTGARAIDQEPYIAAFDIQASTGSGGFVHHGQWLNRTSQPGKIFFDTVSASSIQQNYTLSEMPTTGSGYLGDLSIDSQNSAFMVALSALRNSKP